MSDARAPSSSNADALARTTTIALFGQFVAQLLRFSSTIVLARLLPESAFGINAIVSSVSLGVWMVTDLGLPSSVVRSDRDDEHFVHTAWTLGVVRGVLLLVVCGAIALPVARLYDEPQMVWLLPLSALSVFFMAAESARVHTATRQLRVGRVVALELCAQTISLLAAVAIARRTGHVIALVGASTIGAAIKCILTHLVLGDRMRIVLERRALREIFGFGRWVFLSTMSSYIASRWDIFALGRLQGMSLLGVYGVANQVTSVPNQMSTQASAYVLQPALAAAWRDAGGDGGGDVEAFGAKLAMARRAYLPVAWLLFLGAATTAPAFFTLAYRASFHDAGRMAQALMAQAFLDFQIEASTRALVARGDGRGLVWCNALRLLGTIAATFVGLSWFGFWGFVWGNVVGGVVGIVAIGVRLRSSGVRARAFDDVIAAAVFLALLALSCGVPLWLERAYGLAPAWTTLGACVLVCGPLAAYALHQLPVVARVAAALRNGPGRPR